MFSIRRYITYFKYVLIHKFFVLKACFMVDPYPALVWRCLVHDMSKFKPSEYIPYAHTFVDDEGKQRYEESVKFDHAWNAHQNSNKHHWQYWILRNDDGSINELNMKSVYIDEMMCDWLGAGRAINGEWDFDFNWYKKNKDKMALSPQTRYIVESNILMIQTKFKAKNN